MDQGFQQHFQAMQELDAYCQNDKLEDAPFSDELLDGFGIESYQATTLGGFPSPKYPNHDLPASGRQSPVLPSLVTLEDGDSSQPSDGSSRIDNDLLAAHLQQPHDSRINKGSNASNSHFSPAQNTSNACNNYSEIHMQQGQPSMTSSGPTNMGHCQTFAALTEESLCTSNDSFQSCADTLPQYDFFEQTVPVGRPMSTQVPIAKNSMNNNTSSASVSANLQPSPTSKAQHFIRHPSHLRHQIHPSLPQNSPNALTTTSKTIIGRVPQTMSPTSKSTNRQQPTASPSHSDYQNIQHFSNRPPFHRVASIHSHSGGSPVSQKYQPFQESSLRTSVTSRPGQNPWEAGQLQNIQFQDQHYPDPPPLFEQQSNCSPYMGQHYIGNATTNFTPQQYHHMQPSNSGDTFFMNEEPTGFGFNGSSPLSMKREMSSPFSDYVVSTANLQSQTASPDPHKKRREKQEPKNDDDSEKAVNRVALQTADLTNLDAIGQANVATLINAMHNTDNVEDNLGMQKTWEKIRRAKAFRIKEVCVDLLVSLIVQIGFEAAIMLTWNTIEPDSASPATKWNTSWRKETYQSVCLV